MENDTKRRNLSGIFCMHKFDNERKKKPTCFEDCPKDVQEKWLESLDKEALKNLSMHLGNTIRYIGDSFNIMC
jgi:Fe-S-cluster-containing dehydrogenase component